MEHAPLKCWYQPPSYKTVWCNNPEVTIRNIMFSKSKIGGVNNMYTGYEKWKQNFSWEI